MTYNRDKKKLFSPNDDDITAKKVITPMNSKTLYFVKDTYNQEVLSKYISKEYFDYIIGRANSVLENTFMQKQNYEKVIYPFFIYILAIAIFVCFLIGCLLIYYGNQKDEDSYYISSIIFIVIGYVSIIFLCFYNACQSLKKTKSFNEFRSENLSKFCSETNSRLNYRLLFSYDDTTSNLICSINNNFL